MLGTAMPAIPHIIHCHVMHGHIMHAHVMHAHIMHDHVMHAHAVHCMLYVRINSACQLSLKGPNWFNSGMPTQMLQDQSYSESWHVSKN
jgi:hypothetical protein